MTRHEMSQSGAPRSTDEVRETLPVVWQYVMGDMKWLSDKMLDKSWLLSFPIWILRAMGAPIFLNNPISGLLIIIGMCIDNPWLAICAAIGCSVAIITAVLIGLPRGAIECGGVTFHGMLVGIVLAASVDKGNYYGYVILPIIVVSAISVYLASGLGNIFGQLGLPAFNLPFVVAVFMFISASTISPGVNPWFPMKSSPPLPASAAFGTATLDWGELFKAIPLASAQIYGSTNVITGVLVLAAMFINSPITCINAILAPFLSIFTALAFAAPPVQISNGSFSYNAMLTCCSLAGFFWVISIQTQILSLFSAVFATVVHGALAKAFGPAGVPVVAFPFVFTASIFLAVTSESKYIKRVPMDDISFPELHYLVYYPKRATQDDSMA